MPDWNDLLRHWMGTNWYEVLLILLTVIGIYAAVIVYTRIFGLRSFSKMSSFDFAATVAVGSTMASTMVNARPTLAHGASALLCLYLVQWTTARIRIRLSGASKALDNTPLVLMVDGQMHRDAMRAAQISTGDIYAKLREANVFRLEHVRAVVLETTGDISVLHGPPSDPLIDAEILSGVEGAEAVRTRGRPPETDPTGRPTD